MTFTVTIAPPRVWCMLYALVAREHYRWAMREIDPLNHDVLHVRLRFLFWSQQLRSYLQ